MQDFRPRPWRDSRGLSLCLLAAALVPLAGCARSYRQLRPSISRIEPGDYGLQSKDLVDMSDKMAASLLQIPQIAYSRYKAVIVMGHVKNRTNQPYVSQRIFLARLRALLNEYAHNRIAFVESPRALAKLQREELGGGGGGPMFEQGSRQATPRSSRVIPKYVLKGTFYTLPNMQTTYYLCTFQLVNLRTGVQDWEGKYEVRTLNFGQ